MSAKVRTTMIAAIAAFGVAVSAMPAVAQSPHRPPHGGGGCDIPIKPPQRCP
jgi:Spy/CpxP family protein refolding chaperone